MIIADWAKALLDRRGLRAVLTLVANRLARWQGKGVREIRYDSGIWLHDTRHGFFAYHRPYIRLDMAQLDVDAQASFFWGYRPRQGDLIIDVGAGVGEEVLTFSRAVGNNGKVVCIEAHPHTYRCLEKQVQYNRLRNVIPVHAAATEKPTGTAVITDSGAYLTNRLTADTGIPISATTVDALIRKLSLGGINFLKMNIEGAEGRAILGMSETLRQTEVLCISCHDFLAETTADDSLRTKDLVKEFVRDHGFDIAERSHPDLPAYLRDQVWGYNRQLMQVKAGMEISTRNYFPAFPGPPTA